MSEVPLHPRPALPGSWVAKRKAVYVWCCSTHIWRLRNRRRAGEGMAGRCKRRPHGGISPTVSHEMGGLLTFMLQLLNGSRRGMNFAWIWALPGGLSAML